MTAPRPARPVLVPRPAGRGASLLAQLTARGMVAEHHPLIRITPVDGDALAAARSALAAGEYSHLVITSPTAAAALGPVPVPAGTAVVAVGRGTATALAAVGITAGHVAAGSGKALVAEMPGARADGGAEDEGGAGGDGTAGAGTGPRVLFPASSAASRTVPEGLRAKGYRVDEVTAYRSAPITPPVAVADALATGGFGAIVLTSPMIARQAAALGVHASTAVVTIGDPTSTAARAVGLRVDLQAVEPTDEALADAVARLLDRPSAAAPLAVGPTEHP